MGYCIQMSSSHIFVSTENTGRVIRHRSRLWILTCSYPEAASGFVILPQRIVTMPNILNTADVPYGTDFRRKQK